MAPNQTSSADFDVNISYLDKSGWSSQEIEPLMPGFLMHWASQNTDKRTRVSDKLSFGDSDNDDSSDEDIHRISQEVMEAIEASLVVDTFETTARAPMYITSPKDFINHGTPCNQINMSPSSVVGSYIDYNQISERIWRHNDQRASLYLQERLKCVIPEEFEQIVTVINRQIEALMLHRFGNFLVQCMLELSNVDQISYFATVIATRVASLSKNQFCCHVIQKLLDVSPLVIQARLAAELLDDVTATMSSPYGTHVWQKLLHLPWSSKLPSVILLANNAVHIESPKVGWMAVAQNEAGCATIKSYLSSTQLDSERQECVDELLFNLPKLIVQPFGAALVCKLAVIGSTRARTMALIFSKAYKYCKHPVASDTLIQLLKLKIPSFPARLSAAIAAYKAELLADQYGSVVLTTLDTIQKGPISN